VARAAQTKQTKKIGYGRQRSRHHVTRDAFSDTKT